jgi:hypothetical protein
LKYIERGIESDISRDAMVNVRDSSALYQVEQLDLTHTRIGIWNGASLYFMGTVIARFIATGALNVIHVGLASSFDTPLDLYQRKDLCNSIMGLSLTSLDWEYVQQ